jgi:hypothetical protein
MKYLKDIYESAVYYVISAAYVSLLDIMYKYVTGPPVFQVSIT